MKPCPCETCIALARCRSRCLESAYKFILNVKDTCPILTDYLIEKVSGKDIHLNLEHAIETGRILGYTIDDKKLRTSNES